MVWELLRGRHTFAKIKDSRLVPTVFLEWLEIQLVGIFANGPWAGRILLRRNAPGFLGITAR
jgi:hypothetical protein